jgi:hypothetical protein
MSVLRQGNILGQQRLDVPHIRAMESAAAADFDLLAGKILAGDRALVVKGFELTTTGAVGNPASSLQLNVASGTVLHPLASEHGTIFTVPADHPVEVLNTTNTNLEGSFTTNTVNYLSLDLRRSADDATADLVMFMDANTLLETSKSVPLARLLSYKLVITTVDFSSTPYLLPLVKITTNTANVVTAIEDARPMLHRLGSGGAVPNRQSSYPWPSGRQENTSGNVFAGGDKAIDSTKSWMDAIMTRLWELGGGMYWYSPTADREVKLIFGTPTIVATGDNFDWTLGSQTLEWRSLAVSFANSPVNGNTVTDGSAVITDGQCLYVDLDRSTAATLTAQVGTLTTLGTPAIPGSRFVIAWRRGNNVFVRDRANEVGRALQLATEIVFGVVKLKYAAADPANPLVLAANSNGAYSNTAASGNSSAFIGTGNGTGAGHEGIGGASAGPGMKGTGGSGGSGGDFTGGSGAGGRGVKGTGTGSSPGGDFTGGPTAGTGVKGTGAGGGAGGDFTGNSNGNGAKATSSGSGAALLATSTGSGPAVSAVASGGTGHGVLSVAGGNGNGVNSTGAGSGAGVLSVGGATGAGGDFTGGATSGHGLIGEATGAGTRSILARGASSTVLAALHADTSGTKAQVGTTTNHALKFMINGTDQWEITTGGVLQASSGTKEIKNVTDPTAAQSAATKNYVDVRVSRAILAFAAQQAGTATGTTYMLAWAPYNVASASEALTNIPVPFAGTIKNLRVHYETTVSENRVFTVRKNGSDTSLTCTVSSTNASDTVNSFSAAAGDLISVKCVVANNNANTGYWFVTMEIQGTIQ